MSYYAGSRAHCINAHCPVNVEIAADLQPKIILETGIAGDQDLYVCMMLLYLFNDTSHFGNTGWFAAREHHTFQRWQVIKYPIRVGRIHCQSLGQLIHIIELLQVRISVAFLRYAIAEHRITATTFEVADVDTAEVHEVNLGFCKNLTPVVSVGFGS